MEALYNSNYPILIQGETGTGKTILAKKIHNSSIYKSRGYTYCNLAGLTDTLFESELFGHTKGSFTGAIISKDGFCEKAAEGTLFFDEIGEISLTQQKRLLELLDSGSYYRLGSTVQRRFLGRFIFATNKDLEIEVRSGRFRADLYYRLGGVAIELHPFRERSRAERLETVENIVDDIKRKYRLVNMQLSEKVKVAILNYAWPGNFRELKATIELMVLKSNRATLTMSDIPSKLFKPNIESGSFRTQIRELERRILYNEVVNKGVGINKASKSLGISKTTLIAKLRKYGMNYENLEKTSKIAA